MPWIAKFSKLLVSSKRSKLCYVAGFSSTQGNKLHESGFYEAFLSFLFSAQTRYGGNHTECDSREREFDGKEEMSQELSRSDSLFTQIYTNLPQRGEKYGRNKKLSVCRIKQQFQV